MSLYKKLAVLAFLLIPAAARSQIQGLPELDFQRYFPHLIAVSEVKKNGDFPQGVQYKFITVRDEQEKVVIIALIRREGLDHLSRLLLAQGPIDRAERAIKSTVAKFAENVQLQFEFFDLSDVRNVDDFLTKGAALGWEWQRLQRN
jgi:hypothetical protein